MNDSSKTAAAIIGIIAGVPILAFSIPVLLAFMFWVSVAAWDSTLKALCETKSLFLCDSIDLEKSRLACQDELKEWTPASDYYCDYANAGGKGYYYVTRKSFPPSFAR